MAKAKKTDKPNILVIFGDDIGYWNVGAYTHGMMGRTPNIDSIAKQGALFTDWYGQQSCTAGRAAMASSQRCRCASPSSETPATKSVKPGALMTTL